MYRIGLAVIGFVSLTLAGEGGGFIGRALPVVSGIGGLILGLLAAVPSIRTLQREIADAEAFTVKFVQKWKHRLKDDELKRDLRRLLARYDAVSERAADVAERFRMKRIARVLRSMIPTGSARL